MLSWLFCFPEFILLGRFSGYRDSATGLMGHQRACIKLARMMSPIIVWHSEEFQGRRSCFLSVM